jgi:hypothetical protein
VSDDETDYDEDYEPPTLPPPAEVDRCYYDWLRKPRITRQTKAREAYKRAFEAEKLTFDDLGAMAVIATYRITRLRLYLTGRLMLDEPLGNRDLPWHEPVTIVNQSHLTPADRVNYEDSLARMRLDVEHAPPLLPKTAQNGTLRAWSAQTKVLANDLGVGQPTKAFPFASNSAVRLLTKDEAVRNLWPTARDMLKIQKRLLIETLNDAAKRGHVRAAQKLVDEFGFSWDEAVSTVMMAKQHAVMIFKGTPEQERALAVARAEDVLERAGNAYDRRGELNAVTRIGLFVGVTRSEIEGDDQVDFGKLAAKISNVQIPMRPEGAPLPGLPDAIDVEAEVK